MVSLPVLSKAEGANHGGGTVQTSLEYQDKSGVGGRDISLGWGLA